MDISQSLTGNGITPEEKSLLEEQIKVQEEMLVSTTNYLLKIQAELEKSREELHRQNKDLEAIVEQRTLDLQNSVEQLQHEVEERRRTEQELSVVNSELHMLLYRSSHDFKGPICSAFGLLNLIEGRVEDQEAVQYLQMLHKPLNKLEALTRTTTTIADFRQCSIKPEEIDIKKLLYTLVAPFEQQAQTASLIVEIDVDLTGPLLSDKYLLENLLLCLIENAFRFYKNQQEHRVLIKVESLYQEVKITVEDNGIGIPTHIQHRVYDMFFRGSERSYGSGLGLYLVKIAVVKLGGKIDIKSTEGIGTTVNLFLPNR